MEHRMARANSEAITAGHLPLLPLLLLLLLLLFVAATAAAAETSAF
jgi:hypothetical protein